MATPQPILGTSLARRDWPLAEIGVFPRLRALAWNENVLFASHAYTVLRGALDGSTFGWKIAGYFRPPLWRNLTASSRLTSRLCQDGFHALCVLNSGHMVGTVPGGIVAIAPGETEFSLSFPITRGCPSHIISTPDGRFFWAEHFENPEDADVHLYGSHDGGLTWEVAYTFPRHSIRQVQNIVYDEWEHSFWILTSNGDSECRLMRFSSDFRNVDTMFSGEHQLVAMALVPTEDAIFFSSMTPFGSSAVYRLARTGGLAKVADLASCSNYGCSIGEAVFFTTIGAGKKNCLNKVSILGSPDGRQWIWLREWQKDRWPAAFFQYGNALLPVGKNTTGLLAITTVAVRDHDFETSIWRLPQQAI